jgi:hypothetical protein
MNRPKLARALRIAWSVAWGIVAVLLLVLWVRSYWVADGFLQFIPTSLGMSGIVSTRGQILIWRIYYVPVPPGLSGLQYFSERISEMKHQFPNPVHYVQNNRLSLSIRIPDRFIIPMSGFFSAVSWVRLHRYSLRTLLIATTLIAMVLGAVVYFARY